MTAVNRRSVLVAVTATVAAISARAPAFAQQCVTGPYPPFLPLALTVDCASQRNYQLFRQNTANLGLAGAVSMTFVRGKNGTYPAGNLFLFPWLKPKGVALGAAKQWNSFAPTSTTAVRAMSPIPNGNIPLDEYFCHFVLQAPLAPFIGFSVDEPYGPLEARLGLYSNTKLADGKSVGVDWASSNLNHPWFAGSRQIPESATCNGAPWRKLIIAGLNRAVTAAC